MPPGQSALAFVDDGGRHPTVPHSPPGSYNSPSRLLANHKTLFVKKHTLVCVKKHTFVLEFYACKLGATSSPLEERRTGFSIRRMGPVLGRLDRGMCRIV